MYVYLYLGIPYINTVLKKDEFLDEFFDVMSLLKQFSVDDLTRDYPFFMSKKFDNILARVQNQDLCTNILQMDSFETQVCQTISSGIMTQGLPQTLLKIVNDLQTEYDATKFVAYYRNPMIPKVDMYFLAYYSKNVIKYLIDALEDSMRDSIKSIISQAIGNLIIYSVAIIICNFFLYFWWISYMQKQSKIIQRVVMLIP